MLGKLGQGYRVEYNLDFISLAQFYYPNTKFVFFHYMMSNDEKLNSPDIINI